MLSVCKQTLSSNLQRISLRLASSVVCEPKLEDFQVKNEPILGYRKGSKELKKLEKALEETASCVEEVPIIIGDKEYKTKESRYQVMPHDHERKLAKFYYADKKLVQKAIDVAVEAQREWDKVPLQERLDIWEKAASLMANEYRQKLNATTMLGQAKTVIQAEIDSAAELIDFFRFNAYFVKEAAKYQPISEDPKVTLNSMKFRGIDGFIAAVTPFNFTAIGGNLSYTPALMGNSVLWKPSDTAILSNYTIFKVCREAGVPAGVVNFVPADGPVFGDTITSSPYLGGIAFTGSVPTYQRLMTQVGQNVAKYKNFPRLVGECGGKNYHFVHSSADVVSVVTGTIRSSFEYSGQKCSACSRMYVPESLWGNIKEGLVESLKQLKIGDVCDYNTFTSAVIDERSFNRIKGYIDYGKSSKNVTLVAGGEYDCSKGYFIQPTVFQATDPCDKLMTEEIFGPVVTIYVYKDSEVDKTLEYVDGSTPYALTGAVFAQDRKFLVKASEVLKMSAGNFYINDKSTGSVVGQQPFGGSRMSGTNDKAGGPWFALRFGNPLSIKETFVPLREINYPYMCD